jgi:hypothetical protein
MQRADIRDKLRRRLCVLFRYRSHLNRNRPDWNHAPRARFRIRPAAGAAEILGENPMKLAIGTAVLVLLACAITYGQEQDKDKDKDKPAQQEQKKQEPAPKERPQAQEQQKSPEHQQKAQEQEQKNQTKQTEKEKSDAAKQQQQAAKQQQQQAAKQQQVARQDHANPQGQQAQRDGGNRSSRRISEQEFHQHFGHEHQFHVTRSDDRRFSYGGYYWVYNDPWPSGWAYTDDVYVDEIDGEYYLIDPVHPGIRLLIIIAD